MVTLLVASLGSASGGSIVAAEASAAGMMAAAVTAASPLLLLLLVIVLLLPLLLVLVPPPPKYKPLKERQAEQETCGGSGMGAPVLNPMDPKCVCHQSKGVCCRNNFRYMVSGGK